MKWPRLSVLNILNDGFLYSYEDYFLYIILEMLLKNENLRILKINYLSGVSKRYEEFREILRSRRKRLVY